MLRRLLAYFNSVVIIRAGQLVRVVVTLHRNNDVKFVSREFTEMLDQELMVDTK